MANPGDPGTYQGPDGTWYDASGQPLGGGGVRARHGGILDPGTGQQTVGQPTVPPSTSDGTLAGFTAPAPNFSWPGYAKPPAFHAPTGEEARQEPGFAFGIDQAVKGVDASAAARGTLNSGGNLKDIYQVGLNYADQNYQNVYNRERGTYDENYKTQYADPFQFGLQQAVASNSMDFNQWLAQYQIFRNHALDSANINALTAG